MTHPGKVKWFNDSRGYGFIEQAAGPDVYVHHSVIEMDGYKTLKVGMKVEVCPYISPIHLRPGAGPGGADLPVRVYYEGIAQKHVTVTAHSPDAKVQTATTDSKGIAHLKIPRPGKWLVRYVHVANGTTYTGDLLFEVEPDTKGGK